MKTSSKRVAGIGESCHAPLHGLWRSLLQRISALRDNARVGQVQRLMACGGKLSLLTNRTSVYSQPCSRRLFFDARSFVTDRRECLEAHERKPLRLFSARAGAKKSRPDSDNSGAHNRQAGGVLQARP
jgi:hypothetical protein